MQGQKVKKTKMKKGPPRQKTTTPVLGLAVLRVRGVWIALFSGRGAPTRRPSTEGAGSGAARPDL